MNTTPYWFDSSKRLKFLPLARPGSVDVLVVGAGVTGIVTSYLLKKAGLRVALLERERLASRDSGHATAHLTCVTDKRLLPANFLVCVGTCIRRFLAGNRTSAQI